MQGRFQPMEWGFVLEGEVRKADVGGGAACSVSGVELDPPWGAAERSLFDALKPFEGRKVRITVEVVEHRPVDTLREVLERYRRDCETPEDPPPVVW